MDQRRATWVAFAVLFMPLAIYAVAYWGVVQTHQVQGAILTYEFVLPVYSKDRSADNFLRKFFAPIHWADRRIRRQKWTAGLPWGR
jgi:hypothetical protein